MYTQKVIEHFQSPQNVGEIENADGVGTVGNPSCGDIMKMYIKVENNVIVDIKFQTFGCGAAIATSGAAIATSSITTEMVKGKTIDEAIKLTRNDVADALGGLPPIKMHCSNLATDALAAAIEDYRSKQQGKKSD